MNGRAIRDWAAAANRHPRADLYAGMLCVSVVSAIYSSVMYIGWIPHDEGLLGMLADRTLNGERSHVDFVDTYTGGLNFFHAAGFLLFGETLTAIRAVFCLAALATTAVTYRIVRRFLLPISAALFTIFLAFWGPVLYFAALPSWYNVFLSLMSLLCLFRFIEGGSLVALFCCGLFAGVSVTVKISGVFGYLALVVFLIYRERLCSSEAALREGEVPTGSRRGSLLILKGVFVVGLLIFLCGVIRAMFLPRIVFRLIAPAGFLGVFLIGDELRFGKGPLKARFIALAKPIAVLTAGFGLPMVAFLCRYHGVHELAEVFNGLVVLPQKRAQLAAMLPPRPSTIAWSIPFIVLLFTTVLTRRNSILRYAFPLTAIPILAAAARLHVPQLLGAVYYSVCHMTPFVVAAALVRIALDDEVPSSSRERQKLFAIVALLVFMSFLQYPYFAPIYFYYVSCFLVLTVLALLHGDHFPLRKSYLVAAAICVSANVYYSLHNICVLDNYVDRFAFYDQLDSPRAGGLRVSHADAVRYNTMLHLIKDHSGGSDFIYAGPDMPEIYFLAAKKSVLRSSFEFFDPGPPGVEDFLDLLTRNRVNVVALNLGPPFSDPLSDELIDKLLVRFPHQYTAKMVMVLWRDPDEPAPCPDGENGCANH